jgi:drug/metabolite transporter (DMT)-like permease
VSTSALPCRSSARLKHKPVPMTTVCRAREYKAYQNDAAHGCLAAGITSETLALHGVNAPTLQSFFNYCLLAVTFGTARAAERRPLQRPWWQYAALAVLDVEANYLVTKAYQYTSITSVTLLDCFTIPTVMLLSWLVLKSRWAPSYQAVLHT